MLFVISVHINFYFSYPEMAVLKFIREMVEDFINVLCLTQLAVLLEILLAQVPLVMELWIVILLLVEHLTMVVCVFSLLNKYVLAM